MITNFAIFDNISTLYLSDTIFTTIAINTIGNATKYIIFTPLFVSTSLL